MRKVTKEFEVFEFSELKAEVQEKVEQEVYELEVQLRGDAFCFSAEETLKSLPINYKCDSLMFSLSYSQGDGLSYETNGIYSQDVIAASRRIKNKDPELVSLDMFELLEPFVLSEVEEKLVDKYDFSYDIFCRRNYYVHHNTMNINVNYEFEGVENLQEENFLEVLSERLLKAHKAIAKALGEKGYDFIYPELTKADWIEYFSMDEFLANGDMFNESLPY